MAVPHKAVTTHPVTAVAHAAVRLVGIGPLCALLRANRLVPNMIMAHHCSSNYCSSSSCCISSSCNSSGSSSSSSC